MIHQSDYRQVFKAISVLGGVQVISILIGIIRSKCVAILLGTSGMGMLGLYQSLISLIQGMTSMGLSQSAVRSVAEAYGSGDHLRVSRVVRVLRKCVWYTGFLGMITMVLLSPLLSSWTFGNDNHVFVIILLSIILLLQQINAGQNVILQGMRRVKDIAKAGVISASIGLFVVIPVYYFFGINGIALSLIIVVVINLLVTSYFSRKVQISKVVIDRKIIASQGKEMIKLGIAMSFGGILTTGVSYLIRTYISIEGGLDDVGLYSAGFIVINTYVGLIFSAMSTDYYPRLAAVNYDNEKCLEIVNQQIEIAILIISPLLLFFLVFMSLGMTLLYSNNFLAANGFMRWAIIGMLFRVSSWAIAYQIMAKGDGKTFMLTEISGNVFTLLFSVLGYKFFGLDGLGIAFTTSVLMYLALVYTIAHIKYLFSFSLSTIVLYMRNILFILGCFVGVMLLEEKVMYIIGSFLILVVSLFSLYGLNKRIGIRELISEKFKKK